MLTLGWMGGGVIVRANNCTSLGIRGFVVPSRPAQSLTANSFIAEGGIKYRYIQTMETCSVVFTYTTLAVGTINLQSKISRAMQTVSRLPPPAGCLDRRSATFSLSPGQPTIAVCGSPDQGKRPALPKSILLVNQRHDLGEQYREPAILLIRLTTQRTRLSQITTPGLPQRAVLEVLRHCISAFRGPLLVPPTLPANDTPVRQAYLASVVQRRIDYRSNPAGILTQDTTTILCFAPR
ncbi:hypothetical protein B0T21DRAFT_173277 [Apiosordaria backusii]|uniref:Uncharacterized protein n=1 Tax=Apiosordaria backusii TaxID=314023 RepID=A0AA40BKT2_9PEZI|nr:hypothetical protein B0T21DRAFT_173277 [Apiosordaria backusii]